MNRAHPASKIFFLFWLASVAAAAQQQPGPPSETIRVNRAPVVQWPGDVDREALLYLVFTIREDGTAADIELADGGFHEARFVRAATRALSNATFHPLMVDGKPIEARGVRMPFRFMIGKKGAVGITPAFSREARKVVDLANKKDFAGAHFHAQWMLSEKVILLYEYAALKAMMASTYANIGEVHTALAASREATNRNSMSMETYVPGGPFPTVSAREYVLASPVVVNMLRLRFRLAASQDLALDAANAYAELQGLGALKADDPIHGVAAQIITALQSERTLRGKVRLDEDGIWSHALHRRSFTLTDVQGHLDSIYLQCVGRSRTVPYAPDVDWTYPASWGNCSARFAGAAGTTFSIVEANPATLERSTADNASR